MKRQQTTQVENMVSRRSLTGKVKRVVAFLSAFVLLTTMNSLKFDADTLERIATCGLVEHVHSETCYDDGGALTCGLEAHVHTDACYQQRPTAENTVATRIDPFIPLNTQVNLASDLSNDDDGQADAALLAADEEVIAESEMVDAPVPETELDLHTTGLAAAEDDNGLYLDADLEAVAQESDLVDVAVEEELEIEDAVDEAANEPVAEETVEEQANAEETADEETNIIEETAEDTPAAEAVEDKYTYEIGAQTQVLLSAILEDAGIVTGELLGVGTTGNDGALISVDIDEEGRYVIAPLTSFDRANLLVTDADGEYNIALRNAVVAAKADETTEVAEGNETVETTDEVEANETEAVETTDEVEADETEFVEVSDEAEANETEFVEVSDESKANETEAVEAKDEAVETADEVESNETEAAEGTDEVETDKTETVEAKDEAEANETEAIEGTDEVETDKTETVEAKDEVETDKTETVEAKDEAEANETEAIETTDETEANETEAIEGTDEAEITSEPEAISDEAATVENDNVTIVPIGDTSLSTSLEVRYAENEDKQGVVDYLNALLEGGRRSRKLMAANRSAEVRTDRYSDYAVFDISLLDDGVEQSETGDVGVVIRPRSVNIYENLPENARVTGVDYVLYHIHGDSVETLPANVDCDADGTLLSVDFTTPNFSSFVLKYTVDFEYNGINISFPGQGSYRLSDILAELGITGEIDNAGLELVEGRRISGDLYLSEADDGLYINSDVPFTSIYELTVYVDGKKYIITVTDAQETTDLSKMISGASVKIEGTTYDLYTSATLPDSTKAYKNYEFHLTFNENSTWQYADDQTLTYTMPTGLEYPANYSNTFDANITVGNRTYTIRGNEYRIVNGVLYVDFNSSDPNYSILQDTGNVQIDLDFLASFKPETTSIKFSDELEADVTPVVENGVTASKTGEFNPVTRQMDYTVTVTSVGTNNNVTITDTISSDGNRMSYANPLTLNVNGSDVSTTPTESNTKFEYNLGTMTNGQTTVVKYSADVDLTNLPDNYTINNIHNGLTVKSDEKPTPDNSQIWNHIQVATTGKSLAPAPANGNNPTVDGNIYTYTWYLDVNKEQIVSVAGKPVTDINDSPDLMTYDTASNIIIHVYEGENEVRTDTMSYPSDVNTAGRWTINLPNDTDKTYRYVIEYKTKVDASNILKDTTVTNSYEGPGGSGSTGGNVDVPDNLYQPKKKLTTSAKTQSGKSTWTITAPIPSNLTADLVVFDYFPTSEWYTNDLNGYVHDAVTLYDSFVRTDSVKNGDDTLSPAEEAIYAADGTTVIGRKYTFAKETLQGKSGDIEITLTTQMNATWQDYIGHITYASDARRIHTNNATVRVNGYDFNVHADDSNISKDIKKTGSAPIDGDMYDTQTGNWVRKKIIKYAITLKGLQLEAGQSITLQDKFDISKLYLQPLTDDPYYETNGWSNNQYNQKIGGMSDGYNIVSGTLRTVQFTKKGYGVDITIRGEDLVKDEHGQFYPEYRIEYVLYADPDALLAESIQSKKNGGTGIIELGNSVTWDNLTDDVTVTYEYNAVSKERVDQQGVTPDNSHDFRIKLNTQGATLNNGNPLTLTDTFTNLSIDYATIHFYSIDQYGNKGEELTNIEYNVVGNVLTATIPDSTPIYLYYTCAMTATSGTYKNVAEFFGQSSTYGDNIDWKSSGGATGVIPVIRVLKQETEHMDKRLENIKFALFEKYNGSWKPVTSTVDSSVLTSSDTDSEDSVTVGQVYRMTSSDGVATFQGGDQSVGWNLVFDKEYALREVKSSVPDGYVWNQTYYSFTLTREAADYSRYIYHNGDIIRVNNDRPRIVVKKTVTGINLTDTQKQAMTFEVYDNGDNGVFDDGSDTLIATLTYADIEAAGDKGYEISRDGLGNALNGSHTYTVVETGEALDNATKKSTKYYINGSVVPTDGTTATVTLDETHRGEVRFVNDYQEDTIDLDLKKTWIVPEDFDPSKYPASVTVHLLMDGEIVAGQDATLTATNNWTWTGWRNLEKGHEYSVQEVVPSGFEQIALTFNGDIVDSTITSGNVNLTNNRMDVIDVDAVKEWVGEDKTTPVTVKLYRSATNRVLCKVHIKENWNNTGNEKFIDVMAFEGATLRIDLPNGIIPDAGSWWVEGTQKQESDGHYSFEYVVNTDNLNSGQINMAVGSGSTTKENVKVSVTLPSDLASLSPIDTRQTDGSAQNHYLFQNLPRTDSEGNSYTYWVAEETPAGKYFVTYENNGIKDESGTITIKNTPEEYDDGEIEVNKVWKDKDGNTVDGSDKPTITVKLKPQVKTYSGNVTIYAVDGWGNSSTPYATYSQYTADNTNIMAGDTIKLTLSNTGVYDNSGTINPAKPFKAGAANGKNISYTVDNEGKYTLKAKANKIYVLLNYWKSGSITIEKVNASDEEDNTEVTLPEDITVELNEDNHWHWSSKENGVSINVDDFEWYAVEETNAYDVTYTYGSVNDAQSMVSGITSGSITVTNSPKKGSLNITKTIQKNGVTDTSAAGTFYYAVYDEAYDEAAYPPQTPVATGQINVTSGGAETVTVSNLPYGTYYVYELDGKNGKPIVSGGSGVRKAINDTVYTVKQSGTTATVSAPTGATAGLVNDRETTSVKVQKQWPGAWPENTQVRFTLMNGSSAVTLPAGSAQVNPVWLSNTDVYEWQDLPKYVDGSDTPIAYTVEETAVRVGDNIYTGASMAENWTTTEATEGDVKVFTNTPVPKNGALAIKKEVTPGSNATGKTFTFEVTLTDKNGNPFTDPVKVQDSTRATATEVTPDSNGKLTVTVTGTGTATITEIPDGTTYAVTETNLPTGWKQTGEVAITGGDANKTIAAGETETATITNEEVTTITATKDWTPSSLPANTSVEVTLSAVANSVTLAYDQIGLSSATEMTKAIAGDGSVHWTDLPKYVSGNAVTYTVEETKVTIGGEVVWDKTVDGGTNPYQTGTNAVNGETTFTNDFTEVNVQKRFQLNDFGAGRWVQGYGDERTAVTSPISEIKFKLYRTDDGTEYSVNEKGLRDGTAVYTLTYGSTITAQAEFSEGNGENKVTYIAPNSTIHWAKHFSHLPQGDYKVVELNGSNEVVWNLNAGASNDYYMFCVEPDAKLWVIKNKVTSITAEKEWDDKGNTVSVHPDVTFKLQKKVGDNGEWVDVAQLILTEDKTKQNQSGYQYHEPGTSTDGTNITHPYVEWNYLPLYDLAAKQPIHYRTVEVKPNSIPRYSPSGSVDGDGNVYGTKDVRHATFKNELEVVEVEVEKKWLNADGTTVAPENASVTLMLTGNGVSKSVTLNGKSDWPAGTTAGEGWGNDWEVLDNYNADAHETNNWHAIWENLPKFNASGEVITYTVTETEHMPADYTPDYATTTNTTATAVVLTLNEGTKYSGELTNKQDVTTFSFTKQWRDSSTTNETWPQWDGIGDVMEDIPIQVTLKRRIDNVDDPTFEPLNFTVTPTTHEGLEISGTAPVYTFTKTGLQKTGSFTIASGQTGEGTHTGDFEYYMIEKPVGGYSTLYLITGEETSGVGKSDITNGQFIRNSKNQSFELPATGGVGTGIVYGAGAALLLLAVLGLILLNRKRTDGEGIE